MFFRVKKGKQNKGFTYSKYQIFPIIFHILKNMKKIGKKCKTFFPIFFFIFVSKIKFPKKNEKKNRKCWKTKNFEKNMKQNRKVWKTKNVENI